MQVRPLSKRDAYLNRLIAFQDTEMIKVITGIRRCGKSSLMKLMIQHLRDSGIEASQIIEMNFESMRYRTMNVNELYDYVNQHSVSNKRMYLFFDEIQVIKEWEIAINSFRVDFDCDIYITGSNAYLLSSELATYLSGRYVEIKIYPLSFKEFVDFYGYTTMKKQSPSGGIKTVVTDAEGIPYSLSEIWKDYTRFGGMPILKNVGLEVDCVTAALDGIYSTVIVNDIIDRERKKGRHSITDPVLLRKIILFLADNVGNIVSTSSIGNVLCDEGLLDGRKRKPAVQTIQAYIQALLESYFFYEVKRFDIKGKEYLRTLGKYYIVDIGLRNYLLGYRDRDTGHVLENIIFFELLRRGYDVAIGKIKNKEVDFIATKTDDKKYIQVTETMMNPETRQRELAPLKEIADNYEKIVITFDEIGVEDEQGIKIVNALDFLME